MSKQWQQVLGTIGADGVPTSATALQAFALAFGALPGVQVPAGDAGRAPVDGTIIAGWLIAHWNELTPAQQDAAYALLLPADERAATTPREAMRGQHRAPAHTPNDATTDDLQLHLGSVTSILAGPFGDLGATVKLVVSTAGAGTALAVAVGLNAGSGFSGSLDKCVITVFPALVKDPSEWDSTLAHELFHCYQYKWAGLTRLYQLTGKTSWFVEGSATWAQLRLIGADRDTNVFWSNWFSIPGRPLQQPAVETNEAYEDVGFFGKLGDEGVDLYTALPQAFRTATDTKTAFDSLVDPVKDNFESDWGVSYTRKSERGALWDITGPAVPPASQTPSQEAPIDVPDGGSSGIAAPPFSANVALVTSDAEIIEITMSGKGRVGDEAGNDVQLTGETVYLCMLDKCECPEGSSGTVPPTSPMQAPFDFGFSGGDAALTGTLVGHKVDDYCNEATTTSQPNKFCADVQRLAGYESRDAAAIASGTNPASQAFLSRAITDRAAVLHDMSTDAPPDIAGPVQRFETGYDGYEAALSAGGFVFANTSRTDTDAAINALAAVTKADLPTIKTYAKVHCNVDLSTTG